MLGDSMAAFQASQSGNGFNQSFPASSSLYEQNLGSGSNAAASDRQAASNASTRGMILTRERLASLFSGWSRSQRPAGNDSPA